MAARDGARRALGLATGARAGKVLAGLGRRGAGLRQERTPLIYAPRVPKHPRRDPQIFDRANLLADLEWRVTRQAASQRKCLEEGSDLGRARQRVRSLQGIGEG